MYNWVVDTIRNLRTRLDNKLLISKAKLILEDLKEIVKEKKELGLPIPRELERFPKINEWWLRGLCYFHVNFVPMVGRGPCSCVFRGSWLHSV